MREKFLYMSVRVRNLSNACDLTDLHSCMMIFADSCLTHLSSHWGMVQFVQ